VTPLIAPSDCGCARFPVGLAFRESQKPMALVSWLEMQELTSRDIVSVWFLVEQGELAVLDA
jgi:hypothetical protein